jgi:murein DD-endopeptidase MepM/ murein hydrolase activator NlpD
MQRPDEAAAQLNALLGAQSLSDIAVQSEYQEIYSRVQANVYTQFTQAEQQLATRHAQVAEATHEVSIGAAQASAQLAKVKALQQQAVSARSQVAKLVRSAQTAAHEAHQVALRDAAALNKLKAQEASIIARILATSGGSRNGVSLAGMFVRPLNGPVTSPFGYREHPIFHYWGLHNGVDMAAPCGSPEYAVETGRVAAEYYSDVWGNRLFLNLGSIDGHNFTVIYNHIARYAVGVGDVVRRGQVVAYEGTTGWSTGCHIHFTVLRDGQPVDPMRYIG